MEYVYVNDRGWYLFYIILSENILNYIFIFVFILKV